jgi:hypothetical protein
MSYWSFLPKVMLLTVGLLVVTFGAGVSQSDSPSDSYCEYCLFDGEKHHFLLGSPFCEPEERDNNAGCRACGWTSFCHPDQWLGPCHESCPSSGDLNYAQLAAAASDASVLKRELAKHPDLILNQERRAIQAEACGRVVLHLPLSEAIAAMLWTEG